MPNELSLRIPASCQDIVIQNDSCSTFHSQPPAYSYSGNVKVINSFAANVHCFCGWIAQLCHVFIK